MTLVRMFDDLIQNAKVLQNSSCEQQFLSFVATSETSRRRWENSELECQRLSIECSKILQEKQELEFKLDNARTLLDNEVKLRKRAEAERNKVNCQLTLLRDILLDDKFADEVKLNKIRSLGNVDYDPDDSFEPDPAMPKGILKKRETEDDLSINDIDDMTFDETKDLCDSRRSSKRSRSQSRGRGGIELDILENIASPKQNTDFNLRKRMRRSRSVVAQETYTLGTPTEEPSAECRARSYSASVNTDVRLDQGFRESTSSYMQQQQPTATTCHNFEQKLVLKGTRCVVCQKRLGFGKLVPNCTDCKIYLHNECLGKAPTICAPYAAAGSPADVCRTPKGVERSGSVKKKPYFASPMLR